MTRDPFQTKRLSWRDPDGFVVESQGSIFRAVLRDKAARTRDLLREQWMLRLIEIGSVPKTEELPSAPAVVEQPERWFWLKHAALPFPVYPHEITALQLFDSGRLTLEIAIEAARNGWMLKDASAWNVLHSRGRPVFVDLLSFDRSDAHGQWIAYGQFIRHFLLPLLLFRKLAITPSDVFLSGRDGITPERAYQVLGVGPLFSLTALELVVLPKFLSRRGSQLIATQSRKPRRTIEPDIAQQLMLSTFHRLKVLLERLRPVVGGGGDSSSAWEGYEEGRQHYSDADLTVKREFVGKALQEARSVLDLGCNAGEFSLLAEACGKTVVAADSDHPALSRLYGRIRNQSAQIAPVFLNIGRPTPAVGWLNGEVPSFLDRSAGHFDCILMLGLLHHLIVGERMSLPMLMDLFERLGPQQLILEWIEPGDQKFRQLAGLNTALYDGLNAAAFEACLTQKFRLVRKLSLPCATRVMYHWSL